MFGCYFGNNTEKKKDADSSHDSEADADEDMDEADDEVVEGAGQTGKSTKGSGTSGVEAGASSEASAGI